MSFKQTVDVTQIAVFIDPAKTKALGAAVWSALDEVATFFATASPDGEFAVPIHDAPPDTVATIRFESRRVLVAARDVETPAPPDQVLPDEFLAELVNRQQRQRYQSHEALLSSTQPEGTASSSYSSSSGNLPATPARPRIDARLLGPKMQSLVKPSGWSLVVTDIELTPPPEWRYIIWDQFPLGAVASVAPLDPEYWREPYDSEQQRVVIAKRRVRAACVSIVGALIGLHRCQNESCFLYANVDSVVRLDEMELIGPEHGVAELTNRGFSASEDLLQASATSASTKAGPRP